MKNYLFLLSALLIITALGLAVQAEMTGTRSSTSTNIEPTDTATDEIDVPAVTLSPMPVETGTTSDIEPADIATGGIDVPAITLSPIPVETETTSDAELITQTLVKACEVRTNAAATFDVSEFPKVFVNDPRFPVSPKILQFIRDVTDNPSLEEAGYLDHMLTYYTWWRDGALRLEAIWDKMKAEGRDEMTAEERASLTDSSGRMAGPRAHLEDWANIDCTPGILSMDIDGDVATVIVDDASTTSEMHLVKSQDGQWYIAGRTVLRIHP